MAGGTIHFDLFGHKLAKVLIWGDHEDFVKAIGLSTMSEGADNVVGLIAIHLEYRNPKCFSDPAKMRHRGGEVFWHGFALSLVFWVQNVACGWGRSIKDYSEVTGLLLGDQLDQGAGESKDSRGVEAFGGINRATDQGKVCTVGEGHTIEKIERLGHLKSVQHQTPKVEP